MVVNGILRKTYVPSVGGYKYHVAQGVKGFVNLDEACEYCDKVEKLTGVILTIK